MKLTSNSQKAIQTVFLGLVFAAIFFTGCRKVVVKRTIVEPDTVSAETIFFDDFSTHSQATTRNNWISNGKAHWVWQGQTSGKPGCVDGCLKQNSEDDRALNAVMYVKTPQIADATIETKTRINYDLSLGVRSDANELKKLRYFIGTGIVFRMKDANNYYMFRLAGEEGCVLGKMVDNQWIDLANPRRLDFLEGGRIKPNYWYDLKVKIRDNKIQCFINDSPVISYTDDDGTFSLGHFGLCTFKCFGDFEYIKVTP